MALNLNVSREMPKISIESETFINGQEDPKKAEKIIHVLLVSTFGSVKFELCKDHSFIKFILDFIHNQTFKFLRIFYLKTLLVSTFGGVKFELCKHHSFIKFILGLIHN